MHTLYQLMAESRTDEITRAAHHPARRAAYELRLAQRGDGVTRTNRTRALRSAARAGLPATAAWVAALVAVVS